jgi:alpha-galactosidase
MYLIEGYWNDESVTVGWVATTAGLGKFEAFQKSGGRIGVRKPALRTASTSAQLPYQKTGVSCLGPPRVIGNHVAQNPIHPTAWSTPSRKFRFSILHGRWG